MRCYICDVILDPHEIMKDPNTGKFEPCGKCKDESYQSWISKDEDWEGCGINDEESNDELC